MKSSLPCAVLLMSAATLATLAACEGASPRAVDTVVIVDTVLRVDTVVRSELAIVPDMSLPDTGTGATVTSADLAYLRSRRMLIPVAGARAADLPNTFDEARSAGARQHDAIDILAPRGTPVLSVDHGRIARIDTSDRGGLSLYATDPSGRYVYYYAHLDRYRPGLRDGGSLARGDTIGYVGTTGNAPPNTPHLHFAISLLGDPKRWWDGVPINPWPLLTAAP
jgi:peptidoglycan LD-endopeptidase LytH